MKPFLLGLRLESLRVSILVSQEQVLFLHNCFQLWKLYEIKVL